jgi:mannan endo-1,4-beta-mannosidase|tara:strand:+ start:3024 stop:4367 length:1344 start_codon:yes stop_codon:yes gene_type:complete
MFARSRIALATQFLFICFSLVSGDHEADWFRTTEDGRRGGLDYSRPVSDQVTATTCLAPDSFVRVNGNRFEINGKEFIFAGWNQWEVMEASNNVGPPARHLPLDGREHMVRVMNAAVESGLKVVRIWMHTITKGYQVQTSPGVWNEELLRGLDWYLSEARKRQIRVTLVLADFWYELGVQQYVDWSSTAKSKQDFYTDNECKKMFKDTIKTIVTRRNTINNLLYSEDATIMSYNLINEARCQGCPASTLGSWINEMGRYLKSLAPNALLSLGYEGFYHSSDPSELLNTNPGEGGSDWASREGQSFARHVRLKVVDYVSIHVWPDNWRPKTVEFQRKFIQSRIDYVNSLGNSLGKPFVLEEFGKQIDRKSGEGFSERDKYFASAFALAEKEARNGRVSGTLFWHLYDLGVGLQSSYGIHVDESTFGLVIRHAKRMNAISGTPDVCRKQ